MAIDHYLVHRRSRMRKSQAEPTNIVALWTAGAHDEVYLKKNVIIGHVDPNAASCRALLGIECKMEYWNMQFNSVRSGSLITCQRGKSTPVLEREYEPFQILNCKYEEFSLIVVNCEVDGNQCHLVVEEIFSLLRKWPVERVFLLSSVLRQDVYPDQPQEPLSPMYENSMFTNKKVTKLPSLPSTARIRNPFLNMLLQFNLIEEIPLHCFIIPAHRYREGSVNSQKDDHARQNIAKFQQFLNNEFHLPFDLERSCDLVIRRADQDVDKTLMYL